MDSTFTYNNEGKISAMTYPSTGFSTAPAAGASYTYSYDSMYRLGGMATSSGTTVVNNVSYNAANQLLSIDYPNWNETRTYNVLNQLTNITVGSTENLTYNYPTGTNNGKVSSVYNAVSAETVTYAYDSLNRLLTANGSGWGEEYGFDGFGNLLSKTVTAGSGPSLSQSVNTANNQIVGYTYDANGNTDAVVNGGQTYNLSYDGENRMSSAGYGNIGYGGVQTNYYYDAQNRRIWSWANAVDALGNTTSYTVNVYTPGGQKMGEYLFVPGTTTKQGADVAMINVTISASDQYFGSRRLAVMDQLGSAGTYFPWGEDKGSTNPQDIWSYETCWRDSASRLDYAMNRYYSNAYGRFMTPDPYVASGRPADPGSWNRYAYTRGDPVNRIDPWGTNDCPGDSCGNDGNGSNNGGDGDGGDGNYPGGCDPSDPTGQSCSTGGLGGPSGGETIAESVWLSGLENSGLINQGALSGGGFSLSLSPTDLLTLVEDGFLQANPATIEEIEQGLSEVVTIGGAALASLGQWWQNVFSKSTWTTGSFPTVQEVQAKCSPVGKPVTVPSTNKRNPGGTSVEQEYLCPDGKNYTIHTLFDKNGKIVEIHVRPGAPKYGN